MLLFFIDTLRADHVGCYGYRRPTTPTIDGLAAAGTVFERAFSQSTWSLPSYATIFTSRYPPSHGIVRSSQALGPDLPTLAGILTAHGYATAAFVGGGHLSPRFGLERGFQHYKSTELPWSVQPGVEGAIGWLDKRPQSPFFLFVHGYDVHAPYQAPLGFGEMYDPDYRGVVHAPGFLTQGVLESIARDKYDPCDLQPCTSTSAAADTTATTGPAGWRTGPAGLPLKLPSLRQTLSAVDREHLIAHYDGALTYADACLARLLDALEQRGLLKNTIVIVAGDHGELLFEHGAVVHGTLPYEQIIHVPLVVAGPGLASGRRVKNMAGLIDLAPTLLQLCGVTPCQQHQGKSLAPALWATSPVPAEEPEQASFSCAGRCYSIRTARWHFIQCLPTVAQNLQKILLFDVLADPAERTDLSQRNPQAVEEMRSRLGDWIEEYELPESSWASRLGPPVMEMFRQFGYW
ncbi:MAG: sulfatase [Candidatus Wallbacteria bacterium]|nr:sulfatase [Candidatus Wallbacteria bacterium]